MKAVYRKCIFMICSLVLIYLIPYASILFKEGEIYKNGPYIIVSVDGWSLNTSRNITEYVPLDGKLTTSLLPKNFCDSNKLLMIMVCSAPGNFLARNAIRQTWGNKTKLGDNKALYFLLGESKNVSMQYIVSMEKEKYGDIIQEKFIDSYNNLTLKSLHMLKLTSFHCRNTTEYLLKIDDDMFVNINILETLLSRVKGVNKFLTGKLICGAQPIKDINSKWYTPKYLYSKRWYPRYLSGTGYLMATETASELFQTAIHTPIFHLEDVYLTGICATKAGITRYDNARFTFNKLNHDPCLVRHLITAHHFNHTYMVEMYKLLNSNLDCSPRNNNPSSLEINNWVAKNIRRTDKLFHHVNCNENDEYTRDEDQKKLNIVNASN